MPNESAIKSVEEQLWNLARESLAKIVNEHPDDMVAFFGFYCNPTSAETIEGDESMYIDVFYETLDDALLMAKREEMWFIRDFKKAIPDFDRMYRAGFVQKRLRDLVFGNKPHMLGSVKVGDWITLFGLPLAREELQGENSCDDFWMLIFWRVFDRLIAEGSFDTLEKSSPMRLGYGIHDTGDYRVLRMVNWPAHKGPRV